MKNLERQKYIISKFPTGQTLLLSLKDLAEERAKYMEIILQSPFPIEAMEGEGGLSWIDDPEDDDFMEESNEKDTLQYKYREEVASILENPLLGIKYLVKYDTLNFGEHLIGLDDNSTKFVKSYRPSVLEGCFRHQVSLNNYEIKEYP